MYTDIPIKSNYENTSNHIDKYKQFVNDIANRREFRVQRPNVSHKTYTSVFGKYTSDFNLPGLQLQGSQKFVENFINPNTMYSRILLNWQTGSGKTIGALSIAQKFVENFKMRKNLNILDHPTIFIIGFTQDIFIDAMLKHPGFVSSKEILIIEMLKKAYNKNPTTENMKEYMQYKSLIKRRFTNKKRGGYYNFIGYREFSNRLFKITDKGVLHNFSIHDLYNNDVSDESDESEHNVSVQNNINKFHDAVSNGYLEINTELVNQMRNSLLILDEIHNTYNMQSKNNYGIALQYLLDYLEEQNALPNVVFMSATIMSGNVTEIVSFLNLLIPLNSLPNKTKLTNNLFFTRGKLIPGAAKQIGELTAGRISFLMENINKSEDYPERIFEGTSLSFNGKPIPYLKFTPCPMSSFHYNTLQYYIRTKQETVITSTDRIAIGIADQSLYDMVYPNPESDSIGLYNSIDTLYKIRNAPIEWREKKEISVITTNNNINPTAIIGRCINIKNLGIYSSKYEKLIKDLINIITNSKESGGKIMINHTWIKMSGVNQIQEILLENGFLDELSVPRSHTICNICGVILKDHNKDHEYSPCRFVIIHSDFDKNTINRSIAKFDDIENSDGSKIRILIGSKLISESYDFNSIRYQFIMSSPVNISTLIQIFGRVARRGSHKFLPLKNRNVKIYIYVSTGPKYQPELERYYEKMIEYISIQEINKYIRIYAVDTFINSDTLDNMSDKLNGSVRSDHMVQKNSIDYIHYDRLIDTTIMSDGHNKESTYSSSTYYAYKYSTSEIMYIKSIIIKLFDIQVIWIYEDLLNAIKTGYIENAQTNFIEGNILVALDQLIMYNKRIIYNLDNIGNNKFRICRLGKYYIKFPVNKYNQPIIDIESYFRENTTLKTVYININNYLNIYKSGKNFDIKLKEFINEFSYDESRIINVFMFYDEHFHYSMLKYIIITVFKALQNKQDNPSTFKEKQLNDIYELYKKYKIIITIDDLLNGIYNCSEIHDVIKDLPKLKIIATHDVPIGFITSKFIMMYDITTLKWYEVSRNLFNIKNRFDENDIVVGYIEKKKNGLKFKVRPPLHTLTIENDDSRSLLRGAVCETRTREEQIKLVEQLKLIDKKRLQSFNSFEICQLILSNLLNLELKSRSQKNGLSNSIRWFYLFNDPLPVITTHIST